MSIRTVWQGIEQRRIRAELELLVEDYERRRRTAITMIDDPSIPAERKNRLHVKKAAYESFIHELEKILGDKTPSTSATPEPVVLPYAETVRRALREYINELQYRVETNPDDAEQAGAEVERAEKAYAAISGQPSGEERVKELYNAHAHSLGHQIVIALTAQYLGYTIPGSEEVLKKAGVSILGVDQ